MLILKFIKTYLHIFLRGLQYLYLWALYMEEKYEAVIGLEVHVQLLSHTKIFCNDSTSFGAAPNTHINPYTLALPGVLPVMNDQVMDMAIKLGLACGSTITIVNHFARKNYFYPDLPKGYQITQDKTPIIVGGALAIKVKDKEQKIPLHHAHLEEDAGKNNHELDPDFSLIDLNRAGMPLLEVVTEPAIHNSDEAYQFLTELRRLVRYLEICDGNMEEGSMRCDANVSIRKIGETCLNTRVELKNMNSIRNVKKAIDVEIQRQIDLVESGGAVIQQTRGYNPSDGTSTPQRSKEHAHDYRYFPEPDLPPYIVIPEKIDHIRRSMPTLPYQWYDKFTLEYGLSNYDASVLIDEKAVALYFDTLCLHTKNYKAAANWVLGDIKAYTNEHNISIQHYGIAPEKMAEIIALTDENLISSTGAKKIFEVLLQNPDLEAFSIAKELNILQSTDNTELEKWANEALAKFPDKVQEYRKGKKGLIGLFMGELMRVSGGKADPKKSTKVLEELLKT